MLIYLRPFSRSVRSIVSTISGSFSRIGRIKPINGTNVMNGDNFLLDKMRLMRCIHAISLGPFKAKDSHNLEICAL